jgi:hypothetical protein
LIDCCANKEGLLVGLGSVLSAMAGRTMFATAAVKDCSCVGVIGPSPYEKKLDGRLLLTAALKHQPGSPSQFSLVYAEGLVNKEEKSNGTGVYLHQNPHPAVALA